ncbi:MAG TPA: murein transglycosylase A [Alphaproteobacteria bacterium]|nr:murein transglycosylase A [Alphaproteobacteria bacterium]
MTEQKPPPGKETVGYDRVGFDNIPGWQKDDPVAALVAFRKSCTRILSADPASPMGGISGTAGDWRVVCRQVEDMSEVPNMNPDTARAFLESALVPFRVRSGHETKGQVTGYFEIDVTGSRVRRPGYTVPIYKRPPDLVSVDLGLFRPAYAGDRIAGRVKGNKLVPFDDRAAIGKGALAGRGLELAWLADPVDAFFLSIQGSGRISLPDGSVMRVGYAGQNGYPYHSIGKLLVERGDMKLEDVSMQSIRAWLEAHPDQAQDILDANPSYVFFREVTGDGPLGTEGVPLTPGRSLAVDNEYIGLGTPVFLDGTVPGPEQGAPDEPFRHLMMAQDTGGAITGPLRGDVFWGSGEAAAYRAGVMNSTATFYELIPLALADRLGERQVATK